MFFLRFTFSRVGPCKYKWVLSEPQENGFLNNDFFDHDRENKYFLSCQAEPPVKTSDVCFGCSKGLGAAAGDSVGSGMLLKGQADAPCALENGL